MDFHRSIKRPFRAVKHYLDYKRLPPVLPIRCAPAAGVGTLVVSPDDPGSLGDAAMIRAISDRYGAGELDVSCWRYPDAAPYPGTRSRTDIRSFYGRRAESTLSRYQRLACIGADVMDGFYQYAQSCLRLRLLSLAAAMKLESRLFGFSFNSSPHRKTALEFAGLHPDVLVCVRDPISLQRVERITGHPLRLVADLAFLVKPAAPTSFSAVAAVNWLSEQRSVYGRKIIGLNINPMFALDHGAGITQALVQSFASLIEGQRDMAFVLIPHDYRPVIGDLPVLKGVAAALSADAASRVALISDLQNPAELKGFTAYLDGVLTGRMHLAIAAMGQGVPVAGVVYQGKFEGLLQHFALDESLTVAPATAASPEKLRAFFVKWLSELDSMTADIRRELPAVIRLAERNFE